MRIENLAGEVIDSDENSPEFPSGSSSPHFSKKSPKRFSSSSFSEESSKNRHFPNSDQHLNDSNFSTTEPIITDIKQGLKNPNRANIFINGKFSFSLDISQIVDLKVKIGQILSEDRLSELKKASEFGKLYQRTLEWVLLRPRSLKETKDYLRRKIFEKKLDPAYADTILDRLLEKGYLSDEKFAAYYIENRFVKKGISKKRLTLELYKKGVAKEIIESVLADTERSDLEEAKKIIAKKRKNYNDEKLLAYLVRQGFSYDLAKSLVAESASAPEF